MALLWRGLGMAFVLVVMVLIVQRARTVDWAAVAQALASYRGGELALAGALALLGFACASAFDLLGRAYTGHRLAPARVLAINASAYAFGLNLGALVGGWGLRVRLYSRHGLPLQTIGRVILFAVLTNWSGFVLMAGVLLLFAPPAFPPEWGLRAEWLRAGGGVMTCVPLAYLLLCAWGARRGWGLRVRGYRMPVPSLRLALAQLALSCASWGFMGLALAALMNPAPPLNLTFGALLASSVAGAVTHVPGSLGVLEGSFTALVSGQVDLAHALAAVFVFRVLYYLLPFCIALFVYAALEWSARHPRHHPR